MKFCSLLNTRITRARTCRPPTSLPLRRTVTAPAHKLNAVASPNSPRAALRRLAINRMRLPASLRAIFANAPPANSANGRPTPATIGIPRYRALLRSRVRAHFFPPTRRDARVRPPVGLPPAQMRPRGRRAIWPCSYSLLEFTSVAHRPADAYRANSEKTHELYTIYSQRPTPAAQRPSAGRVNVDSVARAAIRRSDGSIGGRSERPTDHVACGCL